MVAACSHPGAAPDGSKVGQGDLAGWETATIKVGDHELLVAVADGRAEQRQGLTGVDDFGEIDGMLFEFPTEAIVAFGMKETPTALVIDFFDDDMVFVGRMSMLPCMAETCPTYSSDAPFSWALETPTGTLEPPTEGTILSYGE